VRKLEDKMPHLGAAIKRLRGINAALEMDIEERKQAELIITNKAYVVYADKTMVDTKQMITR
jgi:hypothetical protein